jgi:hypothetical protein
MSGKVRRRQASHFSLALGWFKGREDRVYLAILVILAVVSHGLWFTPGSTLFNNDWLHRPDATMPQAWQLQQLWKGFLGLGVPNVQVGYFFVSILWPFIGMLGGGFDAAVKLTIMAPIALLGFISPYLAMRKLVGDKFIAFIAALFYGTTTYFLLLQTVQLPIAFIYALTPLLLLLLVVALETMKVRDWLLFALVYSLGLCYEVRIMYIVTFILAVYAAFFLRKSDWKRLPKPLLITGMVLVGLNAFWLLPSAFGGLGSTITNLTSGGLFGNWLFDMEHAIALSASSWTRGPTSGTFTLEPILPYLWLIPLIVLAPLTLNAKLPARRHKYVVFFLTLALIGLFLTKQVVDPLPKAYPWLYAHFPGFSLFREASKFYLLTALGYTGLIGLGLLIIKRAHPRIFGSIATLVILVALINLSPLITGDIGTLFKARHMPRDYAILNRRLAEDAPMTRALWVPATSQWAYFDVTHPKASATTLMQQEWKFLTEGQQDGLHPRFVKLFESPLAHQLLSDASIHFVIIPVRDTVNDDNFYSLVGNNRQFYIDTLERVPWLKRVDIGTKQVIVYENQAYKPHMSAHTDLLATHSLDNFEQLQKLNSTALKGSFNFALNDKQQVGRGTDIRDVFSDLKTTEVGSGRVTRSLTTTGKEPVLYSNEARPRIGYVVAAGQMNVFVSRRTGLRVNEQIIGNEQSSVQPVGSVRLDPARRYFAALGDQLIPLNPGNVKERMLGIVTKTPRLISTDTTNLVPNPSLELGLWQKDVEDCDPYDNKADVSMARNQNEHSDGRYSLELSTFAHNACTGPNPIEVIPGHDYLLSFDYKDYAAQDGDEIGYQIVFNDADSTTIKKYRTVLGDAWHTVRQLVAVPKDATTLRIRLVSIPKIRSTENALTFFDNVNLSLARTDLQPHIDLRPRYTATPLQPGKNTFTYLDATHSGRNLMPNPSLEEGVWQQRVGDCNAYDDQPLLKMQASSEASDARRSLELAARRHIACTGPDKLPVKENSAYVLSFDHQSPNAKAASYSVSFDDPDATTMRGTIPSSNRWQNFTRTIKTPVGARHMQLQVYARSTEGGSKYIVNRYDNFKLIEAPDLEDGYFVADARNADLTPPQKISYTPLEPTKKLAHVKGAQGPFYLTISEGYHPKWRLELNNTHVGRLPLAQPNAIDARDHIRWNHYLNGWYVDPAKLCQNHRQGCIRHNDGSYDLELLAEFTPQRWFDVGILISAVTLAGCIGYLGYTKIRNRNRPWSLT